MKNVIMIISLVAGSLAFAHNKENKEQKEAARAERHARVKAACADEIAASGCTEELGKGLMGCVHRYKQANKDFVASDSCKAVVKTVREERQERRAERKERRTKRREERKAARDAAPAPSEPVATSN